MLKTISAALLAVSVLAAPALAASTDKTAAPVTKSASVSKNVHNANAKLGRHHVKHARHHRTHKMFTHKMHKSSKVAAKHVTHQAKRG